MDERSVRLEPEDHGYFSAFDERTTAGTLYQIRLDGTPDLFPDPASRFQPAGPHGPSQIVDSSTFEWTDHAWTGISIEGQVLYELHIGTFTRNGTWDSARERLADLAELGITTLEVMPVAAFPGRFGWGYDGVDLFAPSQLYGNPNSFRRFVDDAHSLGLAVILDVVYNHFGPDGNYLKEFSPAYFTERYFNEWGEAINFDGPDATPVREFFVCNARYWIEEFHLDGLRLDATQQIFDASPDHIIKRIVHEARAAANGRRIIVIAENEPQRAELARSPSSGGFGIDALWNDDFHHTAHVAMTGRSEAYFTDYNGRPQEFISSLKWGFLYQGQRYHWQKNRRGCPSWDLQPAAFVNYMENHDQVANSVCGVRNRFLTTPGLYRSITALLLLAPQTPLLFQGQEFGSSSPFLYFADHNSELAPLVQNGREEFLRQFPSIAHSRPVLTRPNDIQTFDQSKLDHTERTRNANLLAMHRDLLRIRRLDPIFRAQRADWLHGAVLSTDAFVLRFFGDDAGDRLIVVNLGADVELIPSPEPLLAEPPGKRWHVLWYSESPQYAGCGRTPLDERGRLYLTAQSAVVFSSEEYRDPALVEAGDDSV